MKLKYHQQKLENLLPVEPPKTKQGQVGQLRSQVFSLWNEAQNLRPLKTEMARMRAKLADSFYALSEANP